VVQPPAKPDWLEPDFDRVPDELKEIANWVVWRGEPPKPGKAKWRKMPYTPLAYTKSNSATPASTTDRSTWRSFGEAVQAYHDSRKWKRPFDGIGFVFDGLIGDDGMCWCGVDFDAWTDEAQASVASLATYTEISPGGVGVHAIARAAPFAQATCRTELLIAEAYCAKRYFTFSGRLIDDAPDEIAARPGEIAALLAAIRAKARALEPARASQHKPYVQQLQNGTARQQLAGPVVANGGALDDLPRESLGNASEPLDLEKFKSALWGVADDWLAAESAWMKVCRICANEAMRNGGGYAGLKRTLWEALNERSRDVDGYDEADNRERFERCIAEYGKQRPPILSGSLYQEAERQGWVWTPPPDPVAAAATTGAGAQCAPLPGKTRYARTYNLLASIPYPFTYDEFHDLSLYAGKPLTDAVLAQLRIYCIQQLSDHPDPGEQTVRDAAKALCDENRFDPEKDWLNGLAWDGFPRLDTWLIDYFGAKDTPLTRAIGRTFLIAKVRRALEPGCAHDWVLALEAPQGVGKTTLARILAGSTDKILDAPIMHKDAREQQEALRGKTVYEIAETEDMRRADVGAIKAFLSRTHDRARAAYAHTTHEQPRRCVYIATTNEKEYLPDEENRRFYPAKVGQLDEAGLKRCRDLLHAEAVAALRNGESAIVPQHLWATAAKEQRKRRIADDWEDLIGATLRREISRNAEAAAAPKGVGPDKTPSHDVREIDHKGGRVWFISSTAVLTNILRINLAQQRGFSGKRASRVMTRLGWEGARVKLDGHTTRGFIFNIAAKGIAAGAWDRYKDTLDADGDADELEEANEARLHAMSAGGNGGRDEEPRRAQDRHGRSAGGEVALKSNDRGRGRERSGGEEAEEAEGQDKRAGSGGVALGSNF
jgi:hypothetical protein